MTDTIESIDAQIATLNDRRNALLQDRRRAVFDAVAAHGRMVTELARDTTFPIVTKISKQRGMTYGGQDTGMKARIGKRDGKGFIHITGRYCDFTDVDIQFKEGDVCVYYSYNFEFLGTIERITAKTVKIREDQSNRITQLDIATFANRNYKFDLEKSTKQRNEWSD